MDAALPRADTETSQLVAVVNQAFVKKFFPKEDPIGRHFGVYDHKYAGAFEIVGIVADAKYNNPRDEFRPMYFRPLTSDCGSPSRMVRWPRDGPSISTR